MAAKIYALIMALTALYSTSAGLRGYKWGISSLLALVSRGMAASSTKKARPAACGAGVKLCGGEAAASAANAEANQSPITAHGYGMAHEADDIEKIWHEKIAVISSWPSMLPPCQKARHSACGGDRNIKPRRAASPRRARKIVLGVAARPREKRIDLRLQQTNRPSHDVTGALWR